MGPSLQSMTCSSGLVKAAKRAACFARGAQRTGVPGTSVTDHPVSLLLFYRLVDIGRKPPSPDPASSRRIHPLPFGLQPFGLKGKRFYGQAKRLLDFRPSLEVLCGHPAEDAQAGLICEHSLHIKRAP